MKRLLPLVTFALGLAALIAAALALRALGTGSLLIESAAATVLVVVYLAGVRWIERGRVAELGPPFRGYHLLTGMAIGVLLFAVLMAVLWALGVYHVTGLSAGSGVARGALFMLLVGITEETLFRGLLYRAVAASLGTWLALLVTAVLFGAAHALNPGATLTSALAIALEAGFLLGAAYAATRQLWLPIGLHAGWNFTEASLFGMSVSGGKAHGGVVTGRLEGPAYLTGGAFGPEASVVAVVLGLVGTGWFLSLAWRRGLIDPPMWRRSGNAKETSDLAGREVA